MKILLTEGSSTSARHTLYALGRLRYTIDICDPRPFCLGRFSRYVRRWYRCPPFNTAPLAYLEFITQRLRLGRYDVLLPVHDQVYLLARFPEMFQDHAGVALPPVWSLEQLQSKARFVRLLDQLGLPHPPTAIICGASELTRNCDFPCFVKLAFGTAGSGVWLVQTRPELEQLAARLKNEKDNGQEILVQQPAAGIFSVTQAVFRRGDLLGAHSYRSRAMGVGGSARCRESVSYPAVEDHLRRLGAHLLWHGALHVEYFVDQSTGRPMYIEANPRIGETMNATLSGTNLCDLLVQVSVGAGTTRPLPSRIGTKTHSLLTSILAVAGDGRGSILKELWHASRRGGLYRGSHEELTRAGEDSRSIVPLAAVICQLLASPRSASRLVSTNVGAYALTAAGALAIQQLERAETTTA